MGTWGTGSGPLGKNFSETVGIELEYVKMIYKERKARLEIAYCAYSMVKHSDISVSMMRQKDSYIIFYYIIIS